MKRRLAAVLATAIALTLTACGGSDTQQSGSPNGADGGLRKVAFGAAPVAPTGALQVGIDQGFFKEEGIEVEVKMVTSGAAVIPGVLAGNPQFSTSNSIAILTARDKGLGIKILTHWSADVLPPAKGLYGVVVPKDSPITSLSELNGKKVAVNALKGLGDFTVTEAVRKAGGGDGSGIQFVEIPFPDMAAALQAGRVDAVWTPEPFLTKLSAQGKLLGYTTQESVPGLASYVITSERLMKDDPELVAKMKRAFDKTLVYADDHTDEVIKAASVITKIPEADLAKAGMESFGTDIRKSQLEECARIMQERGWIKDGAKAAASALPSS